MNDQLSQEPPSLYCVPLQGKYINNRLTDIVRYLGKGGFRVWIKWGRKCDDLHKESEELEYQLWTGIPLLFSRVDAPVRSESMLLVPPNICSLLSDICD